MTVAHHAVRALTRDFVDRYPSQVAEFLASERPADIAELLEGLPTDRAVTMLERLQLDVLADVLVAVTDAGRRRLLPLTDPARVAPALARLPEDARHMLLSDLDPRRAQELTSLLTFPPESAGGLMDPAVAILRPGNKVREALAVLRKQRHKHVSELYVVDDDGRLAGRVTLQHLAIAEPTEEIGQLMATHPASIQAIAPRDEAVELLEHQGVSSLPVVDFDERLIGVIRHRSLVAAAAEEASSDIQAMVGVSRDERALSPIPFAVRKRLPWLQINLGTAFLAAAVVGLFESTIAEFTALAVLLPVVAGQSGNTGAQALAVTMRGLALREIRVRQWMRVTIKELSVGFVNGVAVAIVTGLAVFVWSDSSGLAMVISVAMVFSMAVAALAGATIPMILTTLGQDPAQASSIVLTTVTDVIGFLSFLGLATLASGML